MTVSIDEVMLFYPSSSLFELIHIQSFVVVFVWALLCLLFVFASSTFTTEFIRFQIGILLTVKTM